MSGTSATYKDSYDLGFTLRPRGGPLVRPGTHLLRRLHANGDAVEDTPAEPVPTSGCPEGKDTCSDAGLDPIHNYMDYSYDACYTEFTQGQAARQQDAWLFFRAGSSARSEGRPRAGPARKQRTR